MAIKERILITVRTYPVISQKYMETVCTGGITDKGEWRRLYPVPLRYLEAEKQYKTFDVVEVDVNRGKDTRPESRTPVASTRRVVSSVKGWEERRQWVAPTAFPSLAEMVTAGKTLAPVKVRKVLEFLAEPTTNEWTPAQVEKLRQGRLFEARQPLEKVPFNFRFRWIDGGDQEYNSYVMAWEFGQTWRTYKSRYPDPIPWMRNKWMNDLCGPNREVLFFMGNQNRFRDQFSICGIFGPPKQKETDGTLW